MKALILAGGFGTRLKPLTNNTPKPVLPICNRPFLSYQIELLKKAGIKKVILSLHHHPDKIINTLGKKSHLGVDLEYVVEPKPLGTAGAYKYAEKFLDGRIVVLNGDSLMDFDLKKMLKEHTEKNSISTIAVTRVNDTSQYGLVDIHKNGRIKSFIEKSSSKRKRESINTINAGVYVLEPEILNMIPKNQFFMFEKNLFPSLIERKANFYAHIPDKSYWIDIGSPTNFLKANIDFLTDKSISFRINHTNFSSDKFPKTISFTKSLIDESNKVEMGCLFHHSVVGKNCVIGKNVKIFNSVILPNSKILDESEIHSSVIGSNSTVKKNCRLINLCLGDNSNISSDTLTIYSL